MPTPSNRKIISLAALSEFKNLLIQDLNGRYVPYLGADAALNLGNNAFISNDSLEIRTVSSDTIVSRTYYKDGNVVISDATASNTKLISFPTASALENSNTFATQEWANSLFVKINDNINIVHSGSSNHGSVTVNSPTGIQNQAFAKIRTYAEDQYAYGELVLSGMSGTTRYRRDYIQVGDYKISFPTLTEDTVFAVDGQYLPLTGGALTGSLLITNATATSFHYAELNYRTQQGDETDPNSFDIRVNEARLPSPKFTTYRFIYDSSASGVQHVASREWVGNQGYTTNEGTVIGSGLTADTIVLGNGTVNIKTSSYKPGPSSITWNDSSDIYLPTMKSVKVYVEGKGYTSNQGTVTSVAIGVGTGLAVDNANAITTSGTRTISIASGYKLPTTSEWNAKANSADLGNAATKNYTTSVASGSSDLVTSGAVYSAIANLPTPMQFKGTLGVGGTISTLPDASASNNGYTYKVISNITTLNAKVGDVFVSNGTSWVLIPAGDDVEDTWREIYVNDTSFKQSGISSGKVNFKSGSNVTLRVDGDDIIISSSYTNSYHTSGSWSGLTYTATANGGAGALVFTIPTGTTASTVALGNHNHDSVYLKLAGGTLTGALTLKGDQYYASNSVYGMNANNSDIIGVNSIYTQDLADTTSEGIRFYRDSTHWDSFTISGGVMYFMANDSKAGSALSNAKVVLHSGNIGSYAITSLAGSGSATSAARSDHTHTSFNGLTINTQTDTTPLIIQRAGSNAEAVSYSVNDNMHSITYTNDEKESSIKWTLINTDTEGSDGSDQSTHYMQFIGSNGRVALNIDGTVVSMQGHTHQYAGSSSVGGAANSANKLNTNAGSLTNPVYFANGIPVACTYSLNKTVPADAVFTDTHNTHKIISGYKQDGTTQIISASASNGDIELGASGITAGWYKRVYVNAKGIVVNGDQTDADANTWRSVKVDNVEKLGTATSTDALNFISQNNNYGDVSFTYDSTNKGIKATTRVPSVSNATITIKQTGQNDQTFTLNGSAATITLADNNTTYTNGTGLTLSNNQFSISAANVSTILNLLSTGSSTPTDADYYISQYVGGGTTTTTYHRRPMSALWEYIKGKGVVTGVKVGTGSTLSPSNGVVTLPAYPTKASWNYDDTYLKLSGGNLTGNLTFVNNGSTIPAIKYQGTQATYTMIKFVDNTGDTYGNGISIGGGGLVVIGSGESADTILSNAGVSGGTESTYIGADNDVNIITNIQSGWASRKTFSFTTAGNLSVPGSISEDGTALSAKYQATLTAQTAYSAKGSATKVPQITTNSLGQVTSITEVTITQPTVNNGTLTLQVNGTQKGTFSANQSGNVTINITASDLGLSAAMKFLGTSATAITDGATTNPITIGSTSTTVSAGNVVLYGSKEFVWTGSAWEELGNEGSYALSSVKVEGTGALGGGGTLTTNRTITHNAGSAASQSSGFYKFSTDAYSHIGGVTAVVKKDLTDLITSMTAASGGTDLSLVTTGEKAIWNAKTSNTGTVTSVATGVGLTGGTITSSGTIKAKLNSETSLGTIGTTSKLYAVGVDSNGQLCVNVPWSDNNTHNTHKIISGYKQDGTTQIISASASNGDIELGASGITAGWYKRVYVNAKGIVVNGDQTDADANTWRPVKYGSTTLNDTSTTLEFVAGSNVQLSFSSGKLTISATDTTYESKAAASGGTALSLVTTGEKYTWNNKSNLALVSSGGNNGSASTAARSDHTHDLATPITYDSNNNEVLGQSGFMSTYEKTWLSNAIDGTALIGTTYYGARAIRFLHAIVGGGSNLVELSFPTTSGKLATEEWVGQQSYTTDAVSGVNDGTNWTSITINGTTKTIPSGGGAGIQEISTQYIRIWDLNPGVYILTYNGTKYIYYSGASGTSTHTVAGGVGKVILTVEGYSNTTKYWFYDTCGLSITDFERNYGKTTSSSGSVGTVSLTPYYQHTVLFTVGGYGACKFTYYDRSSSDITATNLMSMLEGLVLGDTTNQYGEAFFVFGTTYGEKLNRYINFTRYYTDNGHTSYYGSGTQCVISSQTATKI